MKRVKSSAKLPRKQKGFSSIELRLSPKRKTQTFFTGMASMHQLFIGKTGDELWRLWLANSFLSISLDRFNSTQNTNNHKTHL